MDVIKRKGRITAEERETHLNYDPIGRKWYADTTVLTHYRKFEKQGWTMLRQYVYSDDGSIFGGQFEAPGRAITIRSAEKKQMSDKQLGNLGSEDEDE